MDIWDITITYEDGATRSLSLPTSLAGDILERVTDRLYNLRPNYNGRVVITFELR